MKAPITLEFEATCVTLQPDHPLYGAASAVVSLVKASLKPPKGFSRKVAELYGELDSTSREMLCWIAQRCGMPGQALQLRLERTLRIDKYGLRARLGGIGKVARRLGIKHPVISIGREREDRYFTMSPAVAETVLHQRALGH